MGVTRQEHADEMREAEELQLETKVGRAAEVVAVYVAQKLDTADGC